MFTTTVLEKDRNTHEPRGIGFRRSSGVGKRLGREDGARFQ